MTSVEELELALSEPTTGVIEALALTEGDILILGVGGKMGPTLARMALRALRQIATAAQGRRVLGVARFSDGALAERLQSWGVETLQCDLLDQKQFEKLPDVANVVFMAGHKFGASGQPALTWAMNALLPALVANKYRNSRIVAFSTGNVYGLSPVVLGGSAETDVLRPEGEYAMSCLARERLLEYSSLTAGTPLALLRLNYANEPRYGVLVDIARQVLAQQPIDLSMGNFNALWQGDANAMALQSLPLASSPPLVLNLAGPEILSVRQVALEFARFFGLPVLFIGQESPDALLSNGQRAIEFFGYPRVGPRAMIRVVAAWLEAGLPTLEKPTKFAVRDGQF